MEHKHGSSNKKSEKVKEQKQEQQNINRNPAVVLPLLLPEEENMRGPTNYSNWIVKNQILVGAYPKNAEIVTSILNEGIGTFICMMQEDELKRQGKHYFEIVKSLVEKEPKRFPKTPVKQLQYIHFPIYDKDTAEDDKLMEFVEQILQKVSTGEKMYIHCRGGHGRTGVVVSCLLARLYQLDAYESMELCKKYHDFRVDVQEKPGVYATPETHEQKSQVYRIVAKYTKT